MACTKMLLGSDPYLSTKQLKNENDYIKPICKTIWSKSKFYVLEPNQIPLVRKRAITYLGSDSEYHYFRNWEKFYHEDEVAEFVIALSKCNVVNPRTIDEETNYKPEHFTFHPWRPLVFDSCGCSVHKDITDEEWNNENLNNSKK
jgi:hypothetical protein